MTLENKHYTVQMASGHWRVPPDVIHRALRSLPGVHEGEDGRPRIRGEIVERYHLSGGGQLRDERGQFVNHSELSDRMAEDDADRAVFERDVWNS